MLSMVHCGRCNFMLSLRSRECSGPPRCLDDIIGSNVVFSERACCGGCAPGDFADGFGYGLDLDFRYFAYFLYDKLVSNLGFYFGIKLTGGWWRGPWSGLEDGESVMISQKISKRFS